MTRALRSPDGLLRTIAGATLVVAVAFSAVPVHLSQRMGQRPFLAFALLGITAIQLSLGPTLVELVVAGLAAVASAGVYLLFGGSFPHDLLFRIVGILGFVGTGSLAAMAGRLLWDPERMDRRRFSALLVAITPVAFLMMMPLAFRMPADSLDRYLYAFDGRFGFQPAFAAGTLFASLPVLKTFCLIVYSALPLAITCVWIVAPDVPDEPGLIRTFLMTGILGVVLFQFLPAAGPIHAFPGFPAWQPAVTPEFLKPIAMSGIWLNAMPAVSVAWALLIFWRTRRNGRAIRMAAGAFLFVILLAPLGLGEHYLIDLVVAIPYAVFVRALWMTRASFSLSRIASVGCNALLVAVWMVLLRAGALLQIDPVWAWCMAAFTVASALWLDAGVRTYRLRTARKRLADAVIAATRLADLPRYDDRRRFPRRPVAMA